MHANTNSALPLIPGKLMEYSMHVVSNYVVQQMLAHMGNSSSDSSDSSGGASSRVKVQLGEAVEELTGQDGLRGLLQVCNVM